MDQTTLKIAVAAFVHDIGKFADPDFLKITKAYKNENAGSFLPVRNGNYTHWHALYSAGFIDQLNDFFPEELTSGEGQSFIRLAAAHHSPSSVLEQIVSIADRISSGLDREEFNAAVNESVQIKDYRKTRLLPVFEHISVEKDERIQKSDDFLYRYPLKAQTPLSIFPGLIKDVVPEDNHTAAKEYKQLFAHFVSDFKKLAHRNLNTGLWFEHFDSLMMRFTTAIPAARVKNVIPDVSLYDHLATTSAIAAAVYLFHKTSDTLNESAVKNRTEEKFLVISGDFNGIQNYIFTGFGDTRKYRSKLLRGRSFSVSLFSELAADMLCRKIGLPHSSVILNAGGRFSILAPNTNQAVDAVNTVKEKIGSWLVERTYGETSISLSMVCASYRDFESKNFAALWDRVVNAMDETKFTKIDLDKYAGTVTGYLDSFCNDLTPSICPLCGKRAARKDCLQDGLYICAMCRDHIFLGENLVKKGQIAIAEKEMHISGKKLLDPVFEAYQLFFPQQNPDEFTDAAQIVKYWRIVADTGVGIENQDKLVSSKYINGYVPVYSEADLETGNTHRDEEEREAGAPKTLNDIARMAVTAAGSSQKKQGVEALGVLKADVDKLGLLMACGLQDKLYTISRVATMSRQLNNYFAVYLPYFLENNLAFNDIYTVFAGGDDLFLLGPWNRITELSTELEKSFKAYVCGNSEIHFSAGITLHKPHTPVDMLAAASEEALETSKNNGRNSITLFNQTVEWSEFYELKKVSDELEHWLENQWISSVFLYRINEFINMAEEERIVLGENSSEIHIDDMAVSKWRSLLKYSVERNAALKEDKNARKEKVKYIGTRVAQWLNDYRGKLRIPLWIIQYNRR